VVQITTAQCPSTFSFHPSNVRPYKEREVGISSDFPNRLILKPDLSRWPGYQVTTRKPRCLANGSKSRSSCNSSYPLSMHRVAITVSMVLRTVTPFLRRVRKFFAA
jgi:hypothetical protein